MKNLELNVEGGSLGIATDSNRDYPDFLQWSTSPNSMFGIAPNSPALRLFLKRVLGRLEKDAERMKRRSQENAS